MKSNNKKSSGPKSTLIIMVRHGKTPSTGKLLPGRAAGLHLS
ncbi:MAG: phosphoglycerate mutase, partial [Actinobacteria bacterium]|nr:phosphoglycerate mutase [Actinomycetota bacterium]